MIDFVATIGLTVDVVLAVEELDESVDGDDDGAGLGYLFVEFADGLVLFEDEKTGVELLEVQSR